MITLSIIKADTGGFVGHSCVHPDQLAEARERVARAIMDGFIVDGHVTSCGDDLALVLTHKHGIEQPQPTAPPAVRPKAVPVGS